MNRTDLTRRHGIGLKSFEKLDNYDVTPWFECLITFVFCIALQCFSCANLHDVSVQHNNFRDVFGSFQTSYLRQYVVMSRHARIPKYTHNLWRLHFHNLNKLGVTMSFISKFFQIFGTIDQGVTPTVYGARTDVWCSIGSKYLK